MIENATEFQKYKPHKLYSLADMIEFIGHELTGAIRNLDRHLEKVTGLIKANGPASIATVSDRDNLVNFLDNEVYPLCCKLGLKASEDRCMTLSGEAIETEKLPKLPNYAIETELAGLRSTLLYEIGDIKFAYISEVHVKFFEQDDLWGKEFHTTVAPEINAEIKAAGNCLAADLNTAAVFHLMRVAEFGLHKLIEHLQTVAGFNLPISQRIEFATWGDIIKAIDLELKRIKATQKDQARESELQFYSTILTEIRAFQYAWRDPVMHARFEEPHEAENIFGHIKRFMQELATRVSLV